MLAGTQQTTENAVRPLVRCLLLERGSAPDFRPIVRKFSRERMKAAAVIVLVLSTVVTSVVVHRLLRPILERNEYYASEKRERENRGVTENFVFVSCGTAVHLERHEKIRNIFCGTSSV